MITSAVIVDFYIPLEIDRASRINWCSANFPDNLTRFEVVGEWKGAVEPGCVYRFIMPVEQFDHGFWYATALKFKQDFKQEAVLWTTQNTTMYLV